MAQKILLTGGAGYIGSHTYIELLSAGYDVFILDNFCNSTKSVFNRLKRITNKEVAYLEADIRDKGALDALFDREGFDAVIHFAALKAVGDSHADPLGYFQTNLSGFLTLLDVMRHHNVRNLVFSSSATVYGEPEEMPLNENRDRSFNSPYGFTKLTAEQILTQMMAADEKWSFGILRYFNPAGAHASGLLGEDPTGIPNNLMPYIGKVATGELPFLTVFGDDYPTPDGTGVRDYIHVEDLAKGHVKSLAYLLAGNGSHTVNLGSGQGYSVLEMLRSYETACGKTLPYKIMDRRAGDVPTLVADPSKAQELLDFKTVKTLDDMCKSSWKWLKTLQSEHATAQ